MNESEKNEAIVEEEKKRTAIYEEANKDYGKKDRWNMIFFYGNLFTDIVLVLMLWRLW